LVTLGSWNRLLELLGGGANMSGYNTERYDLFCKFCGRQSLTINRHINHERCCSVNPVRHILPTYGRIGKTAWNKGLTVETDPRVAANTVASTAAMHKLMAAGMLKGAPPPSFEARLSTSIRQSLANSGGKSKWYEVAGQKVQGTWERDIALKFEELGVTWVKLKVGGDIWRYTWDGKIRSYTPDFYLYLEVKGYWWGQDRLKMDFVKKQHADKRLLIVELDGYNRILVGEPIWERFRLGSSVVEHCTENAGVGSSILP
jgi:hypothetical protein